MVRIESHYASHPSILLRCRALLWFSLNDTDNNMFEHLSKDQITKLDEQIKKDMDEFIDGPAKQLIAEAKKNLAIWIAAHNAVQDGSFDKNEQRAIEEMFGTSILEKLKNFLSDIPASDVEELVFERVKTAREELERLVPSDLEETVRKIQEKVGAKLA